MYFAVNVLSSMCHYLSFYNFAFVNKFSLETRSKCLQVFGSRFVFGLFFPSPIILALLLPIFGSVLTQQIETLRVAAALADLFASNIKSIHSCICTHIQHTAMRNFMTWTHFYRNKTSTCKKIRKIYFVYKFSFLFLSFFLSHWKNIFVACSMCFRSYLTQFSRTYYIIHDNHHNIGCNSYLKWHGTLWNGRKTQEILIEHAYRISMPRRPLNEWNGK